MAGKTISTFIDHSVTLGKSGYNGPLSITSSGDIEAVKDSQAGLYLPSGVANATVTNSGAIIGGYGGNQATQNYLGGNGIDASAIGAVITNNGLILGGSGAATAGDTGGDGISISAASVVLTNNDGIYGGNAGYENGYDGYGGNGVEISAAATFINTGNVHGGYGGVANTPGAYYYRTGGTGGTGVTLSGGASVNNTGLIRGGTGGEAIGQGYTGGGGGYGAHESGGTLQNAHLIEGGSGGFSIHAGGVGGYGAFVEGGSFNNTGTIMGGTGGYGENRGGAGGNGLSISDTTGSNATNNGVIIGGTGGVTSGQSVYVYTGQGGYGLNVTAGSFTNNGKIFGGNGGYASFHGRYNAGAGGAGALLTFYAVLTNNGTITAGSSNAYDNDSGRVGSTGVVVAFSTLMNAGRIFGGNGGIGYAGQNGGLGVYVTGVDTAEAVATNTSTGTITGGVGGHSFGYYYGGQGGAGVMVNAVGSFVNHGHVIGGLGGQGYYHGGQGGSGVVLDGGTFVNTSHVTGGNGGYGYNNGGYGGFGVYVNGGKLVDSGTISHGTGGLSDAGSINSAGGAVKFSAAVGTLEIEKGAAFIGNVVANASAADLLEFSGKSSTVFAGIGTTIENFKDIKFLGGSAWTISGDIAGLAKGQSITGFGTSEAITVTNAAASSGSVVVGTAGVVTITAGGGVIKLDIVGAKVGATNYTFTNYTLKETAAAGGAVPPFHLPELSAVVAEPGQKNVFFSGNDKISMAQPTIATAPAITPATGMFQPQHGAVPVFFTL